MSRPELESLALESVLRPLGDFVAGVGMDKGLSGYSKTEILEMVSVILDAYQDGLRSLYGKEAER